MSKIIWTKTDEAPLLASYSLVPIVRAFVKQANIDIELKDISLAGRILGAFDSNKPDELANLGKLVNDKNANIIKLPNISASIPQLKAAIKELQEKGFKVPDFVENPTNENEKQTNATYKTILGSAVNPVLRMGNSDRRAPKAVKNYAKKFPHSMGDWQSTSKARVSHMSSGDFYSNEKAFVATSDTNLEIYKVTNGNKTKLGQKSVQKGDLVDSSYMSMTALNEFLDEQIRVCKENNILFSVHLKATMMKVSDPVIFGYVVKAFYKDAIAKNASIIKDLGVNFNNGLGDLYSKISTLPQAQKAQIEQDFQDTYKDIKIAMVNSDKGITNLHVPSDVIVDASMPAAIRVGGKMYNKDGNLEDANFIIPDSAYAPLYDETIKDCIANGKLDPTTMGSVSNVGLMAFKAQEYGSHPTTFILDEDADIQVTDTQGNIVFSHPTKKGDIYRMSALKDLAVQDWVKLAVQRATETKTKTIFWLDETRANTKALKQKVQDYLKAYDTNGLDIEILSTKEAAKISIQRARQGLDTISVTGNVLRDYNTDLYPILEVGTSAKMLSIVPLIAGGGLFETGAGGSAPKHVSQLIEENHLRWDSLGEFLAIVPSLEMIAKNDNNQQAKILANTLDKATEDLLNNDKSPKRKAKEQDNKTSHFYLAMYWAKYLSMQDEDKNLKSTFAKVYEDLSKNETKITQDLVNAQGKAVDIGGYYLLDDEKTNQVMRPSAEFNAVIDGLN